MKSPAILPYGATNPDPRPGSYYVSATRDNLRTYHLLLGPFPTHAEALSWVDRVRALVRKTGQDPFAEHAVGTLRKDVGETYQGTANRYLLVAETVAA